MAFTAEYTMRPNESRVLAGRPFKVYRNAISLGLLIFEGPRDDAAFAAHRIRYTVVQAGTMLPDDVVFLDAAIPQGMTTMHVVYGVRTIEHPVLDLQHKPGSTSSAAPS